jgi:hypothetical protein
LAKTSFLSSSATSLYVVLPFSSTLRQTFMLQWWSPVLALLVAVVLGKARFFLVA